MSEGSLRDEIDKLNKNFDDMTSKKEVKKFKLPFGGRVNKKKVKDGWASLCVVNENRAVKFIKAPIKEGTIMLDGAPVIATTDYMLNYKNRPFMIIPSWSVEPFSPSQNLDKAAAEKKLNVGMRLILNRLKSEQIKAKATFSMGLVILILIIIGAAIYYFSTGGTVA